ncbi:hypothetical protein PG989_013313 [Apiospora arundinis]
MPSLTASTLLQVALLPLLLQYGAVAELLGCDAVGCPTNESHIAQCKVGSAALKALGIATIIIIIILDTWPWTWTVGFEELPKGDNRPEAALVLDKNFYLGTPPNMRFDNTTTGCALFFEGVSANLTVPQNKKNTFTSADALNADCVSDLTRQTESTAKPASDSNACRQLRNSVMTKPPLSCNTIEGGNWGACRATTGQGYDLYLVDSERHCLADRTQKALSQVLKWVTPAITVLETDGKAKAELTCLRLVDSVANQTDDESRPKSLGSPNGVLFSPSMYLATMQVSITLYVI